MQTIRVATQPTRVVTQPTQGGDVAHKGGDVAHRQRASCCCKAAPSSILGSGTPKYEINYKSGGMATIKFIIIVVIMGGHQYQHENIRLETFSLICLRVSNALISPILISIFSLKFNLVYETVVLRVIIIVIIIQSSLPSPSCQCYHYHPPHLVIFIFNIIIILSMLSSLSSFSSCHCHLQYHHHLIITIITISIITFIMLASTPSYHCNFHLHHLTSYVVI